MKHSSKKLWTVHASALINKYALRHPGIVFIVNFNVLKGVAISDLATAIETEYKLNLKRKSFQLCMRGFVLDVEKLDRTVAVFESLKNDYALRA